MMNSAIALSGLTKSFGKGSERVNAVDQMDLVIEPGQVYGMLGPNGAGKTTTIRMISGLMRPDSGTIYLMGKQLLTGRILENKSLSRRIGICPQELVIWEGMTLMEQLIFMGQMYDVPRRLAAARGAELLEVMHLIDKKDRLAATLSGGMKRRLNILLGLMHDPEILILDEPQAGLDPQSRLLVRNYIASLARSKTVLLTTHDMEEADKLCDRVAIIDHGRILAEDTPASLKQQVFSGDLVEFELLENLTSDQAHELIGWKSQYGMIWASGKSLQFRSEDPAQLIGTLKPQMMDRGMTTEDIRIRRASLEDVFIHLTGRGLRE